VHVELVDDVSALNRNIGVGDHHRGVAAGRLHAPLQRRAIEAFEHDIEGLHRIVAQVGQHAAKR